MFVVLSMFVVFSPLGLNENREIQIQINQTNNDGFYELIPTNITDNEKQNLRFEWKTTKGYFINFGNFWGISKNQGIEYSNNGNKILWTCCINGTNVCSSNLSLKVTNTKTLKIIANSSIMYQIKCP
ncbi:MAG: hypothetical protein M0Q91_13555 [Methanoregula sp.]|jgi:hypothetical protein|nr:hypothetical protein [Methanoregula sp.]